MGCLQRKLKICHICTKFPPAVSGIAKHVYELSVLQAREGHSITILCPDDVGDVSSIPLPANICVVKLKTFGRPLNNPITPSLLYTLWKNDFDLVHAHDIFLFGTLISALLKPIRKYPLIVTQHTNMIEYNSIFKSAFQNLYLRIIGGYIFKTADKIIVHNSEKMDIFKNYTGNNFTVIPNGIHTQNYINVKLDLNEFRLKHSLKESDKVILFVGRLAYRKGILDLVSAFNRLHKQFSDVNLLIVGDGPLCEEIRSLIKENNIEKNVRLLGFVSFQELVHCYYLADVTVLPSLFGETQGIVTLESLICGTPIVVSNLTCFTSMLPERNMKVVDPGSQEQLQSTLSSLLRNDQVLREMSVGCREFVIRNYDWDVIYLKIQNLIEEVITSQKGSE